MPDKQPFRPYVPEKRIQLEITLREQQIIEVMRKTGFGKFTVHKLDGKLVRIERDESILLNDE